MRVLFIRQNCKLRIGCQMVALLYDLQTLIKLSIIYQFGIQRTAEERGASQLLASDIGHQKAVSFQQYLW
jgi:hypothetical protein